MTDESGETASETTPRGRRGPRKESVIRAEVEAELRERIEAQVRAEMEAKRAEEAEQQKLTRLANDSSPVSGFDISGKPDADGAVTIHFVEDGFTVLGKVWYRGEELTIVPGTDEWDQAPDYSGKKFCLLDEFEQETVWGRRMFREGPWRGRRYTEIDDPELNEQDRAALAKAEQTRNERFGVLPRR